MDVLRTRGSVRWGIFIGAEYLLYVLWIGLLFRIDYHFNDLGAAFVLSYVLPAVSFGLIASLILFRVDRDNRVRTSLIHGFILALPLILFSLLGHLFVAVGAVVFFVLVSVISMAMPRLSHTIIDLAEDKSTSQWHAFLVVCFLVLSIGAIGVTSYSVIDGCGDDNTRNPITGEVAQYVLSGHTSFEFESSNNSTTVMHAGGASFDPQNVFLRVNRSVVAWQILSSDSGPVSSGDHVTIPSVGMNTELEVVYSKPGSKCEYTMGQYITTSPN